MKIYFLRHAHADWPKWEDADDERPLTRKGRRQSRRVAKFLRRAGAAPEAVITSPLPRALQTAEIVAKRLGVRLSVECSLEPGFNEKKLAALMKKYAQGDVMLVGHDPDFSALIEHLTGAHVQMAKAGVACVECEAGAKGVLSWLVAPSILKRAEA